MSLSMLVNGAECGPSNPLQGLSKRFDQDRGVQQDHFGSGTAGPSRQAFRSQTGPSTVDQDAAQFFSANKTPQSPLAMMNAPTPFDFSALQHSLPGPAVHTPPVQKTHSPAPWAADFLMQKPQQSVSPAASAVMDRQNEVGVMSPTRTNTMPDSMQWNASFMPQQRMNTGFMHMPVQAMQPPAAQIDQSAWDREFRSQESSLLQSASTPLHQEEKPAVNSSLEADELARTAGLLVEQVKDEQNPKFKNSEFLGLMRQLRDREMVVDGNDMVQASQASGTPAQVDVKGKGRALGVSNTPYLTTSGGGIQQAPSLPQTVESEREEESEIDRYFRQENEDYVQQTRNYVRQPSGVSSTAMTGDWGALHDQWERFEATASGIKAVPNYQFQSNNPYVLGNSSRTRHHSMHLMGYSQSLYESVLELEAVVQREPTNASAWFELGVKQQENEREQKALHALQRAVDLDPSHLPTWLALAVSYTNDSDRKQTYDSVRQWVDRNERYAREVAEYRTNTPEGTTESDRFANLIGCLIAMARSDTTGNIDADIQIALAVLLNTNEEYSKAQDCFRTALAVRPDDWLLYNRVGATLANSGDPEQALSYYMRALELNPGYIRARFNLGISCINLRRYDEAAQHILDALVLQDSDRAPDDARMNESRGVISSALWDSLKTTCLHMQRIDLAGICDREDLNEFRTAFYQ